MVEADVYLLRRAHVRPRTIAAVVVLNIAVFLLLVPASMGVGVVGVLTTGTLTYVACLPRQTRLSAVTIGVVVLINVVDFLLFAQASPALGLASLLFTLTLSGAAFIAPDRKS